MLETLFIAAALGAGGPTPPPPPTRPAGLSAEVETAFADTLAQSAVASPAPQNKTELLTLARQRYERALKQSPTNRAASLGVARTTSLLGDQAGAAVAFARHHAAHPADAVGYHEAALSFARFGDWPAAASRCATAARLDPASRQYGTTLGFCLARAGHWVEAEAALARVMSADDVRMNLGVVREHVALMARQAPAAEKEQLVVRSCNPAESVGPFVQLTPVAPAPREVPVVTAAYQLRNAAAADVGEAVGRSLGRGESSVHVVENQVVVRGSAATHAVVVRLVGELDRPVPQVVVQALVAQVPLAFLAECGLKAPGVPLGEGCYSLGKREQELFSVALRNYPTREILTRPQLQVRDNQTAHFQLGQVGPAAAGAAGPAGITTSVTGRVTPRIMPDGKTILRVETQVESPVAPAVIQAGQQAFPVNVQAMQTTVLVPAGESVVVAQATTGPDGKPAALLFVFTPHVVRP